MFGADGTRCPDCDGAVPPSARFCPKCGVSVVAPDLMLDPMGVTDSEASEQTNAGGDGDTQKADWRAIGSIAAVAIGLIVWLVLRTPVTTLDDVAEALAFPDAVEAADSRVAGSSGDSSDFVPVRLDGVTDAQPILGDEVGLHLYVGRPSMIARIDLDTGEVTNFDIDGQPVTIWRDQLVLLSDQQILTVPLNDPSGQARLVYDLPVNSSADLSDLFLLRGDRLVMTFQSFGRLQINETYTVVDLESGEAQTWELPPSSVSRFGLVWVPGGGVFDAVDGEFTKVFDGLSISGGPTSGIGYSCQAPDDCSMQAFDRQTGELLADFIFPEVSQPWLFQQVPGSDRLVVVLDHDERTDTIVGQRLFDTIAGDYLPGPNLWRGVDAGYLDDPLRVAVWDDRLVAASTESGTRIQDVTTGDAWELLPSVDNSGAFRRSSRLFFVED